MGNQFSLRVLVAACVMFACAVAASTVLLATGHGSSAFDLPVIVALYVPLIGGMARTSRQVTDTHTKVVDLLNGGTEAALERALDRHADSSVSSSAPPLPFPVPDIAVAVAEGTHARLEAAETTAAKSRP
jgi:hypothetical protein